MSGLENSASQTGESYGLSYEDLIATLDTLVLGRLSCDKGLTLGTWPYEGLRTVVLCSRPRPDAGAPGSRSPGTLIRARSLPQITL